MVLSTPRPQRDQLVAEVLRVMYGDDAFDGAYGGPPAVEEVGLVVINHFNPEHMYAVQQDWADERWLYNFRDPDGWQSSYGVCDSIEQFKRTELHTRILASTRRWCVFFTHVEKVPGEQGGWRWHKWGPYIGEGHPTCEYLADEPGFDDGVWVYHVLELELEDDDED